MSILTVVFVPEGIAMAADSRLTGYKSYPDGRTDRFAISDNSQKLFLLNKLKVGISFCGDALINNKTVADFIRIFEIEKIREDDDVTTIANKLKEHLRENCAEATTFYVCGYKNDEAYIYELNYSSIVRRNVDEKGNIAYRTTWNGEYDAISKLIIGDKPTEISHSLMPLKDAIDFAEFLVDVTIKYQRFEDRVATCGGPIDILVITKDYAKFIKHKILNP